ncbi:MAG TPA: FUSC family protein [Polyangiaceae bacterium]|jgi:uncharacterized membrane protein YccC
MRLAAISKTSVGGAFGFLRSIKLAVAEKLRPGAMDPLLPDLATGVRAAVATVVPLTFAVQLGRRDLAWMALGGWLGTLCDPGGSRSLRARLLVSFALLGAVDVALCEAGARHPWSATLLLASIAFAVTMFRALGAAAGTLGTLLAILAALATGRRLTDPLHDALWFAIGGAVAMVLSSIVWPIWTHLPVRRAVAEVARELSEYTASLLACAADGALEGDPRWTEIALQRPRRVRLAIEHASAVSLAIHARRNGESRMGGNLRVLLGMLESQFLLLVSLGSEMEAAQRQGSTKPPGSLARLSATYAEIRTILVSRAWAPRPLPLDRLSRPEGGDVVRDLASSIARESDEALALAGSLDWADTQRVAAIPEAPRPGLAALRLDVRRLRDALTLRSPIFRHAVRVAMGGAAAALVGTSLSPQHAPWVSVTTIAILQPYTGATMRRAVERVIGTTLGCLVTILATRLFTGPLAAALLMFPFSIAAVVTRPRSYRLFTFFLTPVFLVVAMRYPGDWWTALERGGDTIAGGMIALLAALGLFPHWEERVGLPEALAAMDRAVFAYVAAIEEASPRPDATADQRVAEARVPAALAIAEAETSLERFLAEPLRRTGDEERAMALITYARRLALASTALHTLRARRAAPTAEAAARERVERFRTLLQRTLQGERYESSSSVPTPGIPGA